MKLLPISRRFLIASFAFCCCGLMITGVFAQQPQTRNPLSTQKSAQKTVPQKEAREKGNIPAIRTVGAPEQGQGKTNETAPDVLAEINGEKITKEQIMQEAYLQHCDELLDYRIKMYLIETECKRNNITITPEDITEEIQKMARAFGLSSEDWMNRILEENGLDPETYRNEVLRGTLAIRRLAGARVQVSEAEFQEKFEAAYGPSVQVRQIVHNSRPKMEQIREAVLANPDSFATEAKNSSTDTASAAYGGMIRPIRRHTTNDLVENAVFGLKPKEVSQIVEWPQGNFILFQCEQHFPALEVNKNEVREELFTRIRQSKTQAVADDVFQELQNRAQVQIIMRDANLAKQYPKIAAVVNGAEITRLEIAQLCFKKYGKQTLAERVSIVMLEQECKRRNITITDRDLDVEILNRAAQEMPLRPDGQPDPQGWLNVQAKNMNVPVGSIRNNMVRPLVMLQKLAKDRVKITEEDIQKGFEANHGPRVRCLAIFLDNMRRAQQIWEQANQTRNPEHFGDLAAEYSIHAPSKALRGEIQPIQKFGGMAVLEEHAFRLQPGELSEVIQLGTETYVILFCLGQTQTVVTNINDVRDLIREDIAEKKLRIEMQRYLEELYTRSTISNYLTGETSLAREDSGPQPIRR